MNTPPPSNDRRTDCRRRPPCSLTDVSSPSSPTIMMPLALSTRTASEQGSSARTTSTTTAAAVLIYKLLRLGFWIALLFTASSLYRTTRFTRELSVLLRQQSNSANANNAPWALPGAASMFGNDHGHPHSSSSAFVHPLWAFPESGADIALNAFQTLTNASTATMYRTDLPLSGTVVVPVVAVVASEKQPQKHPQKQQQDQHDLLHPLRGPYFRAPHLPVPKHVLTKTYCGGHCDYCSIAESLPSLSDFQRACDTEGIVPLLQSMNSAAFYSDESTLTANASPPQPHLERKLQDLRDYTLNTPPRAAVHLIRDPLENLVARMVRRGTAAPGAPWWPVASSQSSEWSPGGTPTTDPIPSVTQFRSWCKLIDQQFKSFRAQDWGLSDEVDRLTVAVPCFSDLIRYVHWHNRAIELSASPVRVLYYEDLIGDAMNAHRTLRELADFLSLPVVEPPPAGVVEQDHRPSMNARSLFSANETRAAAQLIRAVASPECWLLLRHYVVPWLKEAEEAREAVPLLQSTAPPSSAEVATPPRKRNASVAWLMSFPNSGTSYTITNVMKMSNATTATNYAIEANTNHDGRLIPVYADHPDGPFLLDPNLSVPWLLLTKTHCTGYCDGCKFLDHVSSLQRFEAGCRETTLGVEPHLKKVVVADNVKPIKAVHLFRSPFDNLYSRMHLGVKLRKAAGVINDKFADAVGRDSAESLQAWCAYIDGLYEKQGDTQWFLTFTAAAKYRFSDVSCYSEIFRWIHWHNMAIEVTESLGIPVHYLYYEDYTSRFNDVVQELSSFLKVPVVDDPLPFHSGKTYEHLFTNKEKRHIAELARFLATEKCWYHMRRYFNGFYSSDDNKNRQADLYGSAIGNPEIVLLLSFPNSGTSYTISNMQNVTRTSAATNTVHETKGPHPVRARSDMMDGPFLYEPHEGKPWKFILTKSHCAGFCDNCDFSSSVKDLSAFESACRTTTLRRNDTLVNSQYNATAVKKIVHLFRNPYDNIVSRMHLGTKKRAAEGWPAARLLQFSNSKEGILSWCAHVDAAFGKNASLVPHSVSVQGTPTDVPCYSEIFRYVQWHNLAFQMIETYSVPFHNIFYEDYETHYDDNVGNLLKFLELERTHDNKPFIAGKHYKDMFEPRHQRGIGILVRQLATPECWNALKRYFVEFDFHEDHLLKAS